MTTDEDAEYEYLAPVHRVVCRMQMVCVEEYEVILNTLFDTGIAEGERRERARWRAAVEDAAATHGCDCTQCCMDEGCDVAVTFAAILRTCDAGGGEAT